MPIRLDHPDPVDTVPESAQFAQGCPTRWSFRTYVEDVREARAALAAYRMSPPERCRIAAALASTIDQTPALQHAIAVAVLPEGDRRPLLDWTITWDRTRRTPRLVRPSPVGVGAEVPAPWILARIRADVYARSTFAAHLRRHCPDTVRCPVPSEIYRMARRLPSARRAAGRRPLWQLAQGDTPPLLPARWAEVDREKRRQAQLRDERRRRRRIIQTPGRRIPRRRLGIPYAAQLGRDPHGRLQVAYWCDEGTWHRHRREAVACVLARLRQPRGRRWHLVRLIRGSWRRWRLLVGRPGERAVPVATYRVRPTRAQMAAGLWYWRRFARLAFREPRLGWREWTVTDDGILQSPYQGTPWPGPRLAAAVWDRDGSVRGAVGIHAYALTLDRGDWRFCDAEDVMRPEVRGLVLAEGEVVRGPEGWRAQAARILALHVPEALAPLAPVLAERYGVPVTVA
jgi:hypothetical protein